MRQLGLPLITFVLATLAVPARAQTCSKLDAQVKENVVSLSVTSPDKMALGLLFVATSKGDFSIKLGPIATLSLGVVPPFVPLPIRTDASGNWSAQIKVPAQLPPTELFLQAATLSIKFPPPRIDFCTSNVGSVKVGS